MVPMNMTYQCLLAIVAGIVTATGAAAETANQLSDAERRAGWQLLFDGRTTAGWRNYGQESLSNGWQVRNGALTRVANEAGDIVTTSTYDKFELSLEYRIAPGGNSGVMFHVVESQSGAADTGPEVQIFDNAAGWRTGTTLRPRLSRRLLIRQGSRLRDGRHSPLARFLRCGPYDSRGLRAGRGPQHRKRH